MHLSVLFLNSASSSLIHFTITNGDAPTIRTSENKDDITLSLLEFQKEYIELHCNRFTENMINEGYTSYAEYYSSLFDDGKEHNPFISSDVFEKTTVQEIFLLTELMFTTLDLQRFYMYKEKAIQLCSTIAYLPIKPDIKITDSRYCCKNI